jgi:hypothetical protein
LPTLIAVKLRMWMSAKLGVALAFCGASVD